MQGSFDIEAREYLVSEALLIATVHAVWRLYSCRTDASGTAEPLCSVTLDQGVIVYAERSGGRDRASALCRVIKCPVVTQIPAQ